MSEVKRRSFDGYISSRVPLQLTRVLFLGPARVVVMRELTRADWEAERDLPPRDPANEGDRTHFDIGDVSKPGGLIQARPGNSPNVPEEHAYFYGVNYLPR